VVVGLYQPLADDGAYTTFVMQATSDHACPLQSLQKTKKRGLSPIRSSSPSRRLGLLLSTQSPACSCGARAKPFGLRTPGAHRAWPSRHTEHAANA